MGVPSPRRVKRAPRRRAQPQTPGFDHFHTPGSQEMAAGGCRSPAGGRDQGPGWLEALGVAAAHRDLGPACGLGKSPRGRAPWPGRTSGDPHQWPPPTSRCLPTVRSRPRPGPARGSGLPPAARPRRLPWRRRYLPPGPQPGPGGGGERGGWRGGGAAFYSPPPSLPFAASTSADVTGRPPPSCTARGREMEPGGGGTQRKGTAAPELLGPGGMGTSRGRRGVEGRAGRLWENKDEGRGP